MNHGKSILKESSFELALKTIELYKFLTEEKKEYIMSRQILKSGTSIGANIREAQNAQSPADFIHKLHIAQKECDETLYWFELLCESGYIQNNNFPGFSSKTEGILKMLKSAILEPV